MTASTRTAAKPPTARTLHEICQDAARGNCGECWALPGDECVYTTAPVSVPVARGTPMRRLRGHHVARFCRGFRRRLISGADLIAVLQAAGMFTPATVIRDEQPDGAR